LYLRLHKLLPTESIEGREKISGYSIFESKNELRTPGIGRR